MLREPKLRPGFLVPNPVPRAHVTRKNRLLVVLACAALALALGFWATRGRVASGSTPATAAGSRAPAATRASPRAPRARLPARAGSVTPARVRGTVYELGTTRAVGDSEVVFSGPRGETTARAGTDGVYEVFVRPGASRPFVRARRVASVG